MCNTDRLPLRLTRVRQLLVTFGLLSCVPVGRLAADDWDGVLRGHEGAVMMGLFTPDGQQAVTVSTDQTARLWSLVDGTLLREYTQHTGPIFCLAISRDGGTLVTGAQDNTLRVWDLPLPHPLESLTPHAKSVRAIVLHPDGRLLLAASDDQSFAIHSVNGLPGEAGSDAAQLRKGHSSEVLAAACRNDAAYYASSDAAGKIILWSPFLPEPQRTLVGHAGRVSFVRFHGNNQQLVTGGDDGCLRVWQLLPAPPRTVATLGSEVVDLSLQENQPIAVVAQKDGAARVLNLTNDETVAEYPNQPFELTSVSVAPNNTWVALGGVGGQTAIVNFADGAPRGAVAGHQGEVTSVAPHADSVRFATAGSDGTVRLWQQPQAESPVGGHAEAIRGVVSAAGGQWFATISDDRTARIWDANGAPQRQLGNHEQPLRAIAISHDDTQLATGDAGGIVWIWNPGDGSAQGVVAANTGSLTALAFAPDRSVLVTAGADHLVRGWKLPLPAKLPADGEEPPQPAWEIALPGDESLSRLSRLAGDAGYAGLSTSGRRIVRISLDGQESPSITTERVIKNLSTSHDGATLVGVDDQGQAHIWDAQGTLLRTVMLREGTVAARLSKDGNELLVADAKPRVRICDAHTGLVREELPASASVSDAVWSGTDSRNIAAIGGAPEGVVLRRALLRLMPDSAVAAGTAGSPPQPVTALAMTPDQQYVLASRTGAAVEQWKLDDGTLFRQLETGGVAMQELAVTPNGQQIVGAGSDDKLHVWQLGDGQPVRAIAVAAGLTRVAISPDSTRAATGHRDGRVRVWELATGLLLETFEGHTEAITGLRFLSDGRTVVSGSADKTVRLAQTSIVRTIPVSEPALAGATLYNNGSHAITAAGDGRVVMTDLNSGAVTREFRVPLTDATTASATTASASADGPPQYASLQPTAVASRNDNQRVAAGTQNGQLYIWNANNGDQVLATFDLNSAVTALGFSPDNQKLAAGTADGRVQVFGPSIPGIQPQREWLLHQEIDVAAPVTDVVFSADSRSVWTSLENGGISRWGYAAPGQIRQFNHGGPVYGVAVSADGRTVVSCSTDQTVRVWDVTTGQQRFQLNGHQGAVHAIALNPDETLAVSSGADGTLRLWDIIGGRQIKELTRFDSTMYSIAIHPEGQLVAAAGADRQVHLLNLITGEEQRTLTGHSDYIHSVQFSREGNKILSYGYAGYLKTWNTADGKLEQESREGNVGNYANISPDGRRILLSNGDGTARVVPAP